MNSSPKPWYASKTIIASLVAMLAMLASLFGFDIGTAEQTVIVDAIFQFTAIIMSLLAILGRLVADKPIR